MSSGSKARLALTLITIVWGSTFPLSKIVLDQIPPFYYLVLRYTCAVLIMLLLFGKSVIPTWKTTWRASLPIGVALGLAYIGQTAGINLTSANKAGFYTSLSVVLVPLLQAVWLKKRPSKMSTLSVIIALVGLALLSNIFTETPDFNLGDAMVIASALMFALHILLFDRLPSEYPRTTIVTQQFAITAAIGLPMGLLSEHLPSQLPAPEIWGIVFFLSLIATVLAFSVQAWAQQRLSATHTALILILEPVFSALFSWIWLGETLGIAGTAGATLIVASLICSSLETAQPATATEGE